MGVLPRSCERARSRVSLDLDDELSELEGAMLRAHTSKCGSCAAFAAETALITHRLRRAPLEPLPASVSLPARRRTVGRLASVGAAAAVAVLAAGIGTLLSSTLSSSPGGGLALSAPPHHPTAADLAFAYLDAPRGLPQYPAIAFRPHIGLRSSRSDA